MDALAVQLPAGELCPPLNPLSEGLFVPIAQSVSILLSLLEKEPTSPKVSGCGRFLIG